MEKLRNCGGRLVGDTCVFKQDNYDKCIKDLTEQVAKTITSNDLQVGGISAAGGVIGLEEWDY